MHDEELVTKMESLLERRLTPDERTFLLLGVQPLRPKLSQKPTPEEISPKNHSIKIA